MITIDGANTNLRIENFANLEEILVRASSDSRLDNRIVTDVLLNDEVFSELYPHLPWKSVPCRSVKWP